MSVDEYGSLVERVKELEQELAVAHRDLAAFHWMCAKQRECIEELNRVARKFHAMMRAMQETN